MIQITIMDRQKFIYGYKNFKDSDKKLLLLFIEAELNKDREIIELRRFDEISSDAMNRLRFDK